VVFIRRAYLDLTGTLPPERQVRAFLQDRDLDKRARLIDSLLEADQFADYWAMRWSDILRVKAEFPINLWPNAAQAYYTWIKQAIRDRLPYDQFARQLLTASGSNFTAPQVNFLRATQSKDPVGMAQAVALTFMGFRADAWPQDKWRQMARFFEPLSYKSTGQWKEQIVYFDPTKTVDPNRHFILPDGKDVFVPEGQDPRYAFADWLVVPENPWFAKNIVNRIWYWLMGRGIIHEPDDIRPDNPPSNQQLLAFLQEELVASGWDLRHIYSLIAKSQVYQLSCIPRDDRQEAAVNFAYYPIRRLDAEVLIDAICQITGTTESYSSMIPEPFTFVPQDHRSIALQDGSITSPFLEMFGRPPRDTGLESERNNRITAEQSLHLLNSSHIQRKLVQGPGIRSIMRSGPPGQVINRLYLTILSRFPTPDELQVIDTYVQSGLVNRQQAMQDLAWALVNSVEFLYRH
jgi:hypothetical protein